MTLRMMYLFPSEHFQQSSPQIERCRSYHISKHALIKIKRVTKMKVKQHSHDKWVELRTKMLEAGMKETEIIHRFDDFLRKLLPQSTPQKTPQHLPKIKHRRNVRYREDANHATLTANSYSYTEGASVHGFYG